MPTVKHYEVKELRVIHNVTVCAIEYKTPRKLPDVKVPAIKLPTADSKIRRKVRVHIICVLCGGMLAVMVSFIDGGMAHFVPFIPTLPNAAMEVFDRIANR